MRDGEGREKGLEGSGPKQQHCSKDDPKSVFERGLPPPWGSQPSSFPSPPLQVQGKEAGREEAASQFGNWQFGNWRPGSLKLIPFSLIPDLEITVPIRHSQHMPGKVEYGVYESGPRKSIFPPRTELRRGDWKTDSTSSTASKQVAPDAFTAGLQQVPLGLGNMLYDEPRRS